jgi:hypothetical protein
MIKNKVYIWAICFIAITWLVYFGYFGIYLSYTFSNDVKDWSDFGGYIGGVLTPLLSFLTIVLLVRSLSIQVDAANELRLEIGRNKKNDDIRNFESTFFNMINTQKDLFESFKLVFYSQKGQPEAYRKSSAVIQLEDIIQTLQDEDKNHDEISFFVKELDSKDDIYSVVRPFCIIVKLIKNRLSDTNGFTPQNRKDYFETLINFTDYSLFRLVLLSINYLDYEQLDVVKDNDDMMETIKDLGAYSYLTNI